MSDLIYYFIKYQAIEQIILEKKRDYSGARKPLTFLTTSLKLTKKNTLLLESSFPIIGLLHN